MSETHLNKAASTIAKTQIHCNNLIADTIREQANSIATDVLKRGLPGGIARGRAGLCSSREFSMAMFGEDYTLDGKWGIAHPEYNSTMMRLGISDTALRDAFNCEVTTSDEVKGDPFTYRDDLINVWAGKTVLNAPLYRSEGSRAIALYMLTLDDDPLKTLTGRLILPVARITSDLTDPRPNTDISYDEIIDVLRVHRTLTRMNRHYSLRTSPDYHWGKHDEEPASFSTRQIIGYQALMGTLLGRDYGSNRTAARNLLSAVDRMYEFANEPSNLDPKRWDPALTEYFKNAR